MKLVSQWMIWVGMVLTWCVLGGLVFFLGYLFFGLILIAPKYPVEIFPWWPF